VAYTGGLNIADEYINKKKRFGYWKDTAVKIQGDAVDSFTVMFLEVWNVLEGGHLEERYLRESKSSLAKDGFVIPYYDTPYNGEEIGKKVYLDIIHQAQESIYIMTPYFIIDYEILYALCYSAKSGVDVKIILPHIPDKRWIFYTSRTFYGELLRAGVEVYEYLPGFLHAKSFASDGNKAVVGTVNMDYRSFYLHLECGAYFYNTPVSKELEEDFIETLGVSQKITMDIVEDFPFYQRMIGRLMRLIAPLL
ncbi:MAG TPA: phospholipase D-like domain-containing protein, partial [Clostridia bacterium]|nr:phospholipase D-like domain-containing protein [Clostridia bacterium]